MKYGLGLLLCGIAGWLSAYTGGLLGLAAVVIAQIGMGILYLKD